MKSLSSTQIKQYQDKGFVAPIEALSQDEANEVKDEIEFIEKKWPKELEGLGRNNVHYISPIFDKVVHNSKILDAVEDIIGTNILVGGTTLSNIGEI
jgi:coproporphyrinogen III oxidase